MRRLCNVSVVSGNVSVSLNKGLLVQMQKYPFFYEWNEVILLLLI